jgi:hypothetical protein
MINHVDKNLNAQDITEQDELIPVLIGDITGPAHEFARFQPFVMCDLHLLAKLMRVADEAGQDLTAPRRDVIGKCANDDLGNIVDGDVSHFFLPKAIDTRMLARVSANLNTLSDMQSYPAAAWRWYDMMLARALRLVARWDLLKVIASFGRIMRARTSAHRRR